jgi:14-3-3 protein epsilon
MQNELSNSNELEMQIKPQESNDNYNNKSKDSIINLSNLSNDTLNIISNPELFEKNLFMAKLCISLCNYEDSLRYVDEMAKLKETELSFEEREVFMHAYSYYISKKRTNWRFLNKKEENFIREKNKNTIVLKEIINKAEDTLIKANEKLIYIINNFIFPKLKTNEGKTFFFKVKADHSRYLAEISHGAELKLHRKMAFIYYKEAFENSLMLNPLDTLRLNISLNYSVFFYEVLNNSIKSLGIATFTLNEAMKEMKSLDNEQIQDEKLKDSLDIIKLIKDNIYEWAKRTEDEINMENELFD